MTGHGADKTKLDDPHGAALKAAIASPTEHVPRLVTSRRVRERMHHGRLAGRFNNWLGVLITRSVGTMWAAYVFALIALVSLPSNIHSKQLFILWLSSSFLQLVLLPIIIVGQNIQATAADKRAEATYKDASAVLHEAREIQRHLHAQRRENRRVLAPDHAAAHHRQAARDPSHLQNRVGVENRRIIKGNFWRTVRPRAGRDQNCLAA